MSVKFHSLSYCRSQTNSSKSVWSDAKSTASLTIYSASLLKVPASTTVPGLENTNVSNPF